MFTSKILIGGILGIILSFRVALRIFNFTFLGYGGSSVDYLIDGSDVYIDSAWSRIDTSVVSGLRSILEKSINESLLSFLTLFSFSSKLFLKSSTYYYKFNFRFLKRFY